MRTIVDNEYARHHVRANYRYKRDRGIVNERESSIELLYIRRAIFDAPRMGYLMHAPAPRIRRGVRWMKGRQRTKVRFTNEESHSGILFSSVDNRADWTVSGSFVANEEWLVTSLVMEKCITAVVKGCIIVLFMGRGHRKINFVLLNGIINKKDSYGYFLNERSIDILWKKCNG